MRDKTKQSLYNTWANMIQRCTNPNSKDWKNYGGRGIYVCDKWRNSFKEFEKDVGPRPPGLTLDRFPDNDGPYAPDNFRWATRREQALNSRLDYMTAVKAHADKKRAQTHCKNGHEFTPENTYVYKEMRTCRVCRAAWDRFLYHEKKIPIEQLMYPIGKPGRKPKLKA